MKLHIVVLDFRWHTVPSGRNIIEQCISVFECHCMSVCVFFLKVQWEPEPEPNQHCSQMLVKHAFTVFGLHWPLLDVRVVARQVE